MKLPGVRLDGCVFRVCLPLCVLALVCAGVLSGVISVAGVWDGLGDSSLFGEYLAAGSSLGFAVLGASWGLARRGGGAGWRAAGAGADFLRA